MISYIANQSITRPKIQFDTTFSGIYLTSSHILRIIYIVKQGSNQVNSNGEQHGTKTNQ